MKFVRAFLLIVIAVFVLSLGGTAFYIASYPSVNDIRAGKYTGVVFGAGITRSSEPSEALKYRLDKAADLYKKKKIGKIFISGKIAETFVMKSYLVRNKVPATNIIVDFKGNNTYDTIVNIKAWLSNGGQKENVAFISQKYHLPRIVLIAKKIGFENPLFIAADHKKIDRDENVFFILRESLAYEKTWLFDRNLK
jgi:SanA protein